ncbi:hypothetical protein ACVWWO_006000 [Bradyrhizobium sp. F1.13.1]
MPPKRRLHLLVVHARGAGRDDQDDAFADPQGQRLGDHSGLDAVGLGGQRHGRGADRGFDNGDVGGFFGEEIANGLKAHSGRLIPDLRAGGDA